MDGRRGSISAAGDAAERAGDFGQTASRPSHIQAAFDSGDHLHPNDAGYKAMAESIDLKLLSGNR
jgi:lysophospholipase L1-like esterase